MKAKTQHEIERHPDAMSAVGGYTLDLYCCVCNGSKYNLGSNRLIAQFSADGPKCYYEARRLARRDGWVFHKDGYASCPKCSN